MAGWSQARDAVRQDQVAGPSALAWNGKERRGACIPSVPHKDMPPRLEDSL